MGVAKLPFDPQVGQQAVAKLAKRASRIFEKLTLPLGPKKKAEEGNSRNSKAFVDQFLTLPEEIHLQVLSHLKLQEVIALRLTSRPLHAIVQNCESSWIRPRIQRYGELELKLYPPPAPSQGTLRYIIDMENRRRICDSLAGNLLWCLHDTFVAHQPYNLDKHGFSETWVQCVQLLTADLFCLNHFFETYRDIILRRAFVRVKGSDSYRLISGTTDWQDQAGILEQYGSDQIQRCLAPFGLLLNELDDKVRCGSSNRRASLSLKNGWPPYREPRRFETCHFEILLVIGGLHHINAILQHKSYDERTRALETFFKSLSPQQNKSWRETWTRLRLAPDVHAQLDKLPHAKIGLPSLRVLWLLPALQKLREIPSESLERAELDVVSREEDLTFDSKVVREDFVGEILKCHERRLERLT